MRTYGKFVQVTQACSKYAYNPIFPATTFTGTAHFSSKNPYWWYINFSNGWIKVITATENLRYI
tara:strand:- start:41 stop:232 length:192 start_codon:yes stop_codon:yes gene_type:complete